MTCEEFARMLDNYDSLTNEEMTRMDIHADTCAHCKREIEFMRSIMQATKTLPEISVPADFLAKLNERIDAEEKKGFIYHLQHNWQKYSAVAACMLLAAVIGSNYNMLLVRIDNSINDDNTGVVSTAAPMPSEAAWKAVAEADAENSAENGTVNNNRTSGGEVIHAARTAKETAAPSVQRGTPTSAPVVSNNAPSQVSASAAPEANEPYSLDLNAEQGVMYAMNNGADVQAAEPTPDTSYTVAAMSDDMTAEPNGRSRAAVNDEPNRDDGYNLDNMIIVSSDDYKEAFDIIDRYLMGRYDDEHYVVSSDDIDNMLKRLRAEGIGFNEYISKDSDDIAFRIITE